MSASEARAEANRRNAQRSTGPRTDEGKARSRENSLKHGMTGDGVVIPREDVDDFERKFRVMKAELKPSTEMGVELVRRIALLAVRLKRSQDQENAHLAARVRRAFDEFEAPEGVSAEEAEELRAEAADLALFDPSKDAVLARKYEAAAERGFYKAIQEFRRVEREARADAPPTPTVPTSNPPAPPLGSFSPASPVERPMAPPPDEATRRPSPIASSPAGVAAKPPVGDYFEVPIAIGKPPGADRGSIAGPGPCR